MAAPKDLVTCEICTEKYNETDRKPKILTCHHTYCMNCLRLIQKQNTIACPKCRKVTSVRKKGVDSLQDNFYIIPLLSNHTESTDEDKYSVFSSDSEGIPSDDDSYKAWCETCMSVAGRSCNLDHEIVNYSTGLQRTKTRLEEYLDMCFMDLNQLITALEVQTGWRRSALEATEDLKRKLSEIVSYEDMELCIAKSNLDMIASLKSKGEESIVSIVSKVDEAKKIMQEVSRTLNKKIELAQKWNAVEKTVAKIEFCQWNKDLEDLGLHNITQYVTLDKDVSESNCIRKLLCYVIGHMFLDNDSDSFNSDKLNHRDSSEEALKNTDSDGIFMPTDSLGTFQIRSFASNINKELTKNWKSAGSSSSLTHTGSVSHLHSCLDSEITSEKTYTDAVKTKPVQGTGGSLQNLLHQPDTLENHFKLKAGKSVQNLSSQLPEIRVKQINSRKNRPHCYMDFILNDSPLGRIVIALRPDFAPQMCENFIGLCTGKHGYGYKGSKVLKRHKNSFISGGDITKNDGSGGCSIYKKRLFEAERCPLKGRKGSIRMKGMQRTKEGRALVGSQFLIWVGDQTFKDYKYTLVFGDVVEGLEICIQISNTFWGNFRNAQDAVISECGLL